MIRSFFCILFLAALVTAAPAAGKWLVYERCELADDKYFDGDSFSVKALSGYVYVFRLYGVDCPETDDRSKTRLTEQAKDFEIEEKDVIKWGKKASAFTKKFLRKPFTVYTRKSKARGASKKARYYAMVVNADGKRLDEALVEAGLARAFGMPANWDEPFWLKTKNDLPRKMDDKRFMTKLRLLENKAKRDEVGVWEDK